MHPFDVARFRSLLVVALACSAVSMTSCDGGCPEGTTLKKGVCAQLPQGNTTSNQSVMSASGAKATSSAGNRAAATPNGSAGNSSGVSSNNASTATQAGSAASQSTSASAQPTAAAGNSAMSAAAGASMTSVPMAGTDASGTACTPAAEACDSVDNDCDGKVDEEIAPQPCGVNKGICKPGTIQCHNGKWDDENSQCQGATGPSPMGEECDAQRLDENCDGVSNEGCACTEGETMPCSSGKYTCKMGTVSCVNGKFSGQCQGEVQGTEETCDGKDNDCDGTPDNGGDALCTGGRHCAAAAGCVECNNDDACKSDSDACNTGYCDLARHECKPRPKPDHTKCSSSGTSGVCRGGSCFNGCIDATDCNSSIKEQCEQGRCVVPIECGNSKVEAGEECDDGNRSNNDNCLNTCKIAKCGDGFLNQSVGPRNAPIESCEKNVDQANEYTCDYARCERAYVYTPCTTQGANSSECGGGYCDGTNRICLPPCSGAGECVTANGRIGVCYAGCQLRCDKGGTSCPSGTSCKTSTVPLTPGSMTDFMKICLR